MWKSNVIRIAKFILIVILVSSVRVIAQDLKLRIPKASVDRVLDAAIVSRYFSYGAVSEGWGLSYYDVAVTGIELELAPGNVFALTFTGHAVGAYNSQVISFDASAPFEQLRITGVVELKSAGTGYKIIFTPTELTTDIGDPLGDAISDVLYGIVRQLPEISVTSEQSLFPDVVSQYFTSALPVLSTTENEIILSLNLAQGPRFFTFYNSVNQRNDIGSIEDEETSNNFVPYPSPATFAWNSGESHTVQSPVQYLDADNGKNKFWDWQTSQNHTSLAESAPRRIQLTAGNLDATYIAQFNQAQHLQLSNRLIDGGTTGGSITYDGNQSGGLDLYDYRDPSLAHSVLTSVPDGLYGANWSFLGWTDGVRSSERSIVLDRDISLSAYYKRHLTTNAPYALGLTGQRRFMGTSTHNWLALYEGSSGAFALGANSEPVEWTQEGLVGLLPEAESMTRVPSLVVSHVPDNKPISCVYDEVKPLTGDWNHTIYWEGSPEWNGAAWVSKRISMGTYPSTSEAPAGSVLAERWGTTEHPMIIAAWVNTSTDPNSMHDIVLAFGDELTTDVQKWSLKEAISGITNPTNLAMAVRLNANSLEIYLAWEENTGIKVAQASVANAALPAELSDIHWISTPKFLMTNEPSVNINVQPVLAFDGFGKIVIAWVQEVVGQNLSSLWLAERSLDNIGDQMPTDEGPYEVPNTQASGTAISSLSIATYPGTSDRKADVTLAYVSDGVRICNLVTENQVQEWRAPYLVKDSEEDISACLEFSQSSLHPLKVLCLTKLESDGYYHLAIRDAVRELSVVLAQRWNMVSVPVTPVDLDFTPESLFPLAGSAVSTFDPTIGYYPASILSTGRGYWIKPLSPTTVVFKGENLDGYISSFDASWNLVGAPSDPIKPSDIHTTPTGISFSSYFGYNGGYAVAETLKPGNGYWVKADGAGTFYVNRSTSGGQAGANRVIGRLAASLGDDTIPRPVLIDPPSGVNYIGASHVFYWSRGSGAGKYHFQLSTNPASFASCIKDTSVVPETVLVRSLNPGTYYWRVSDSTNGVGTSLWSAVSSFTACAPAAPSLTVPTDGAPDQLLTLVLAWSASAGANRYHVQVSDDAGFTTLFLNDSSLTGQYRGLNNLNSETEYYWRVRATNGSWWSAWSVPRHFATGAPPYDPVPQYPANGATNQLATFSIRWWHSTGADSYQLQLGPNSGFTNLVVNDTLLTDTSRLVSNLTNFAHYYWRVRAKNVYGVGQWSPVWSFTVGVPPSAPTLATPASGATSVSVTPTLTWNGISGATGYRLQLAKQQNFNTVALDYQNVSVTSKQTDCLDGTTQYYWRVNATNQAGTSAWSEVRNFTTSATPAPPVPTLTAPANNATGISLEGPVLQWGASTNATDYRLQVSTSSTFTGGNIVNTYCTDLAFADWDPLVAQTVYYWHVQARNAAGSSAWSSTWQFTTVAGGGGCGSGQLMAATEQMDALTVTDANGLSQTLFVYNGMDSLAKGLAKSSEMPPEPINGAFSVRFASGKFFESLHPNKGRKSLPPIAIKGARYPVTIDWDLKERNKMKYWMPHPENRREKILLERRGRVGLNRATNTGTEILALDATANSTCGPPILEKAAHGAVDAGLDDARPKEFALRQNMPNPFNPVTIINYELPLDARVDLRVYNMLGQEVAILVDNVEQAGYHAATFNASNVASGVYFYRFKAEQINAMTPKIYTKIMKMVLLK